MMIPTEHEEQVALMVWRGLMAPRYPLLRLLFAVPNGGHRHKAVAAKLQAEGVESGVPDLCLPVPTERYHGLWIELKRTKGGRVSQEQQWWLDWLNELGYRAVVCRGWQEAAQEICAYLGIQEAIQ